ncbi:hypothetical protein QBC47DRAFT_397370 [Echria macrotheca]|uniref:HNH nuclease domain-containing protein n=1 Tax=Echria macrotheca TaxID=438768 RepID=A0AAJ0FHT2_9PEZI|nr:hypothetical protein QBC47DRAFT_397370 [Echria macrotheca]
MTAAPDNEMLERCISAPLGDLEPTESTPSDENADTALTSSDIRETKGPSATVRLDEIHEQLDRFLESSSLEAKEGLLRLLTAPLPPIERDNEAIVPSVEEARMRLGLTKMLQDSIRQRNPGWRMRATDLSIIYTMPLGILREVASTGMLGPDHTAEHALEAAANLVREFFGKRSLSLSRFSGEDASVTPERKRELEEEEKEEEEREVRQPRSREVLKCLYRENNVCLFTGMIHPKACHIIPFRFNSTSANTERLRASIFGAGLFGNRDWDSLLTRGRRASDRAWNMLAMNMNLEAFWKSGCWAVKCLGISLVPSSPDVRLTGKHVVKLRFHWMPRRHDIARWGQQPDQPLPRNREIDLESEDGLTLLNDIGDSFGDGKAEKSGGYVAAFNTSPLRLISGQIFYVPFEHLEDAERMKDVVDLQWVLVVVASREGAIAPQVRDRWL